MFGQRKKHEQVRTGTAISQWPIVKHRDTQTHIHMQTYTHKHTHQYLYASSYSAAIVVCILL